MKLKTTNFKSTFLAFAALLLMLSACGGASRLETSTTSPLPTTDTAPNNGLALTVSISSMDYQPGSIIAITIDESNTLAKENYVPAADLWADQNLTLGACGTFGLPFGLVILQGNYDKTDFYPAVPLQSLWDPNALYLCPPPEHITSYDFEPLSDFAITYSIESSPGHGPMTHTAKVTGFWSGQPPQAFSKFTPGIYTVVGDDEWGALVIEHFTIVNP
jgi:hypothetical protein